MPKKSGVYKATNGTWYFKVRSGIDPDSGKPKQVTRRGYVSAAAASEARQQFIEQVTRKPEKAYASLSVTELVEAYHVDAAALGHLSERTVYDERSYVRNYVAPYLADVSAHSLTPAKVRSWMVSLATKGGLSGKPLGANTVRLARSLLLKTFTYGVAADLVEVNPVQDVPPPGKRKKIPAHWSPEQAREFLALHEGDRLYPLWAFMLSSGVRVSELVWLQWVNIDLDQAIARLQDIPTTIGYQLKPSEGKNAAAVRTIDLDDHMVNILKAQAEQQEEERSGPGYQHSDYVFTTSGGLSYHPQTISKRLTRESKQLGLPRLSAKGLRHTCATLMLAGGVPPKVAAERLGHADTRMFTEVYSHVTPTMQKEAAAKLGSALFGEVD